MNRINKPRIIECGICFESLDLKQIDLCTELYCDHTFHTKCLRVWCETCEEKNKNPTCPLCRECITSEYLEILGVREHLEKNSTQLHNTVKLFTHIIKNKLYLNREKLVHFIARYPNEMNNIKMMLENFALLNSLDINFDINFDNIDIVMI